jgi:GT2 family glycosyltransferase/2-polyprenyl-3-methyl-5-hydroxy-6-metoxy-1,4-benzoquinol methylase/glycosyltransferase involved in cell wall biosynthesis
LQELIRAIRWRLHDRMTMNLFDADARAIYAGDVDFGRRNSLAALFDLVPQGAEVLDVGIGGGALGRRLTEERGCQVDGVTLSNEESRNAAAFYRRIEVADLSVVGLDTLFGGQRYRAIICADVLEHLPRPTRVLDACRNLLAPDGVLLLSIPNVSYVGLLGELLGGEFRYRIEGLLDRTHLRFFTRRSLLRMLREAGWHVDRIEAIRLELPDSEFRVSFDSMPPPVQRYLLAMPDALTYQFIVCARVSPAPVLAVEKMAADEADIRPIGSEPPRFSALLYLKTREGYGEDRKIVALGRIGDARQIIRFVVPAQSGTLTGLRLDPADRPGFLHLYGLRLVSIADETFWRWDGDVASLARGSTQQIVFRLPWFSGAGAALLLCGEDPFFELPLSPEQLHACQAGATLEVELGWPMSADYALFVDELTRRDVRLESLATELSRVHAERQALEQRATQFDAAPEHGRLLAADRDRSTAEAERLRAEAESLRAERERLHAQHETLRAEHEALCRECLVLQAQMRALRADEQALREEALAMKNGLQRLRAEKEAQARLYDSAAGRLRAIESSLAFKLVMPLIRGKVDAASRAPAYLPRGTIQAATGLSDEVDVIVPVYKGLEETRACLESVLASTPAAPFRLVIVNDASPEPEISQYLRDLARREARVLLLENAVNAGFVASVNRGMQAGAGRDVVLLNSDTEVAGDWLDRLRRAAGSDSRAATVTPFSNSAEICSYPRFCADNPLPAGLDTAAADRLFAAANAGLAIEIPTAVGFCMYIRRACLEDVGLFDTEHFGRGYGEENDFCMRARKAGWRSLLAMDVFVGHAGGVSFGEEKAKRVQQAQQVLARLHPEYPMLVHEHLAADPARTARLAVDVARLRESGLPSVLCVLHNAVGGGTERQVRELASELRGRANVLLLRPAPGGETILEWAYPGEDFRLGFRLPGQYEDLIVALRSLGVAHVHYHHLLGHSPSVWGLPQSLGVAHDFTAHDFYSLCPQITLTDQTNRYCGESGVEQCSACLKRSPAPGGASIEVWRDGYRPLLEHARFVLTPSSDAAARLRRYFAGANIVHVPHLDMAEAPPAPAPQPVPPGRPLRIAVLGALSPIKGADVLESVAADAARRGLPLEFHLLGFAYRSLLKQPRARLTVHGQYEESELPDLLAWLKPDVAWFPALWPETYSYTLSACLKAGLPIVAPRLGAFEERLHGRAWTWLCPWDQPAADWATFFEGLLVDHFMTGRPPEPVVGVVATPGVFTYRDEYLRGVELPALPPALTHEFLEQHRAGRSTPQGAGRSKRTLLALVMRLRRAPILRGLVRRIPLRWQTRVKVWLST